MANTITQRTALTLARPTGPARRRTETRMQCAFTTGSTSARAGSVPDARRVGQMRTIVAAQLRLLGLDTLVDSMALVVSELVTNAVEHGGGSMSVSLLITGTKVRLEVGDSGAGRPCPRSAGSGDENGRGLFLVDSLTAELGGRWGFDPDRHAVWVEIPTPPSTP